MIKNSGNNPYYHTGSKREVKDGKGRMDLLPFTALIRLSKHFEEGGKIYGDRNWEKGQPIHQYIDSALRHIAMYMEGETDEDHLCASAWNILCAMQTEMKIPDMQDIPNRLGHQEQLFTNCSDCSAQTRTYCMEHGQHPDCGLRK